MDQLPSGIRLEEHGRAALQSRKRPALRPDQLVLGARDAEGLDKELQPHAAASGCVRQHCALPNESRRTVHERPSIVACMSRCAKTVAALVE
jgi:hypothetical protein